MKRIVSGFAAVMVLSAFADLPDPYVQVDYVQSTHSQYVDTGYKPNANTTIALRFAVDDYQARTEAASEELAGRSNAYVLACYDDRCQFAYGNKAFCGFGQGYSNQLGFDTDTGVHELGVTNGVFYLDGDKKYTSSDTTFKTNPQQNLYVFALNAAGTAKYLCAAKVYSLVISEDGEVLHEFVPAFNKDDKVAGLYDLKTDVFLTSRTQSKLKYSPEVQDEEPGPDVSDYNVWRAASDGLASDAANWSLGVPQAGQKILFDPRYSEASCEWDAGMQGLTDTVASWTQAEGYPGTITIDTLYDGVFTALTVTGDVDIRGGSWTHKANTVSEDSRIKVVVGGNVTIAAGAKLNASGKGFATATARPGSAKGCHASPMGTAGVDGLYGDVKKPEALGSGNDKGPGGGAIYIEATGAFVNDGELNVNSLGGAAGSIYVKAASVSGEGKYNARAPESVGDKQYLAGSGGRIAFELTGSPSVTDDEAAFVNGKCITGFAFNTRGFAAGGTVLVKSTTRPNGTLYVNGLSGSSYSYVRAQPEVKNMLAIPAGETWTLDGIVFLSKAMSALRVAQGTTLSLPGGLASVRSYGAGAGIGGKGGNLPQGNRGLVMDGGTLALPETEEHLVANNWTLQGCQGCTLDGDVRVNAGGRIGVVAGYITTYAHTNRCDLTVTGDLTVEAKGSIDATGGGWKNFTDAVPEGMNWSVNSVAGAHGGVSSKHASAVKYVYDSILNPMLPGEGAQNGDAGNAVFGGGCVKLTVGGTLTLAGSAQAKAAYQDTNGGAGGSINITCGRIVGSGAIDATTQSAYGGTQGGGGRVAIRLTGDGADFADYPLSRITVAQAGEQSSGGTVYLQTAADGENCGTVYVKGHAGNTASLKTPFPSLAGGGENDDFSKAKLQIVSNGKVILSANAKVGEFRVKDAGSVEFNGKTLKAGKAFLAQADGTALPKLSTGTYSAARLNEITGTSVFADSVGGGALVVAGDGMTIVIR